MNASNQLNRFVRSRWFFLVVAVVVCMRFASAGDFAPVALPVAKPGIPRRLELILGMGEETRYRPRIRAVHALGRQLSEQEVAALLWFLHRKKGDDPLPLEYLNPIKNDIVNALLRQERPPRELGAHLIAMFRDGEQDAVWRDYCVQFLGVWYPRVGSPSERAEIRKVFDEALGVSGSDRPGPKGEPDHRPRSVRATVGTALIALSNLVDEPDIDRDEVGRKACAVACDSDAGNAARISAFGVCARLGCRDCLGEARKLAAGPGSATLRMSCIAAIGALGNRSDLPLLERCRQSRDIRLRTAAKSGIEQVGRRTR